MKSSTQHLIRDRPESGVVPTLRTRKSVRLKTKKRPRGGVDSSGLGSSGIRQGFSRGRSQQHAELSVPMHLEGATRRTGTAPHMKKTKPARQSSTSADVCNARAAHSHRDLCEPRHDLIPCLLARLPRGRGALDPPKFTRTWSGNR